MYVWLDDFRDPKVWSPEKPWVWVKTAEEAINLISTKKVIEVSLDHDLGTVSTGYDVAVFIEQMAYTQSVPKLIWHVHSANTVAAERMKKALRNADKFWI